MMECVILYNEPHHQTVQAFSALTRKSIINLYRYRLILLNFVTLIFSAVSILWRTDLRIGHIRVVGATHLSDLVCNICSNVGSHVIFITFEIPFH